MLAYAAVVVLRSVLMAAGDGPTTMFARELPQVIVFLGTIFWVVSFTFGVILMINQRQILSVRESADARLQAEESLRLAERQLALVREQRQRKDFVHDLHDGVGAAWPISWTCSKPAGWPTQRCSSSSSMPPSRAPVSCEG
jgi:signal transduction histidine kinase